MFDRQAIETKIFIHHELFTLSQVLFKTFIRKQQLKVFLEKLVGTCNFITVCIYPHKKTNRGLTEINRAN